MWRKGGCGGRVVDVKGGWWMWREDGCEGRVVYVEEGCMWREVTPVLLVLHSLPTHSLYSRYWSYCCYWSSSFSLGYSI